MTARFRLPLRARRGFRTMPTKLRRRVLRSEWLEPRLVLSGGGLSDLTSAFYAPTVAVGGTVKTTNAAPTVAQPITANGNAAITGKTASLSVLGADDAPESNLLYAWSITSAPTGGSATFNINGTNAAKLATATFNEAGAYTVTVKIVDAGGLSVTSSKSIVVSSALTSIGATTVAGQAVGTTSVLNTSGVSQSLVVLGLDQFGKALAVQPVFTWTTPSLPSGASAPTYATSGGVTTVTFAAAGYYSVSARVAAAPSLSFTTSINAVPTVTSIAMTPGTASVMQAATQQFTAKALDQFRQAMAAQPVFAWSSTSGTINASGLFTAPTSGASCTVSAKSGSVTGTAAVTLTPDTAPTIAQAIAVNGNAAITGKTASLTVLGSDVSGESSLLYSWSITSAPTGGSATFNVNATNAAKLATATFTEAGAYTVTVKIVDALGLSATSSKSVVVTPTLTSISAGTATGQSVAAASALNVTGVSQSLVAQGLDQFGKVLAAQPVFTWTTSSLPAGASTPTYATSGGVTTITFAAAGNYSVSARTAAAPSLSFVTTLDVISTLTTISLTPSTASVIQGATQQFTAKALDQFRQPMAVQPVFTWSDSSGTISGSGLFTAPNTGASCAVSAKSGAVSGTASVTLTSHNTGPTVAQAIVVNGNAAVTGKTASLSVLGSDPGGESSLLYSWSITSAPTGGSATFNINGTNAAKLATATFTEAGAYTVTVKIVDAAGLLISSSSSVVVSPTLTLISASTPAGQAVTSASLLNVNGVSQAIVLQTTDQFGNAMAVQPTFKWSAPSLPSNSAAPTYATSGNVTTITFAASGYYTVSATATGASIAPFTTSINVNQTLTSIAITPNTPSVLLGATQQFTAKALDQFTQVMANQQVITWSASVGTINATGMYTAPLTGASATVTVKSGSVTGTATVTLTTNSGGLQDPTLAALVASLDADGSISRQDMIQILDTVAAKGAVSTTDFSDLKQILYQASTLKIPSYVQVLAADVIDGNAANATYQGQALGNLAAGSSATQLTDLVDKWFLGTDHPTLCNTSVTYQATAGSLFPHTPSHNDEFQGELGDCYFISAMGTLADSNPAAVQNMFIDNGDGTFTVRFYTGTYGTIYNPADGSIGAGFSNGNITADYVTVDRMLPASSSGILAYADYGASVSNTANALWIPLAEKAYAQWNQTGNAGRDGTNALASIQGGWMATVDAQVLGHNATDYIMTTTKESVAIAALTAHKAVTIGTLSWNGTQDGLYAGHAYAIIGYNASSDTFTLYNPWGDCQPGQLTWTQLQTDCSQMAVCDTSGTIPVISASLLAPPTRSSASAMLSPSAVDIIFTTGGSAA